MELCKYFPVASDRMGAIWTLSSIEDICIIEFGPAGTTHFAIEVIGALNGEERAKIYSTHMDQNDVTFGKYDRLENSIKEVDENISPKYIFVMASSVSSVIGADVKSVCMQMQEKVSAKLIPINIAGLKDEYYKGIENVLCTIVKDMVKPKEYYKENVVHGNFNIMGSTIDSYNFLSNTKELKRMVETFFNKKINTTFTAYCSAEEIERASLASLNIVTNKSALKAAKLMEKKFNIPYIYMNLYGLNNTIKFIENIKEITGWDLDTKALNEEVGQIKKHIFSIKRRMFFYEGSKDVSVFGDYDVVVGLSSMMSELGLNVDRKQIINNIDCEDESIVASSDEVDRMDYLNKKKLLILFADGVTLDMDHNSKLDIQVSNPNLDRINIYPYTPHIGLRGCLWMIENIVNVKLDNF